MGPYRTKIRNMHSLSFEEKLILMRKGIPGPIRRLLGTIFIIPTYVISFLLAIGIMAPAGWILFGDPYLLWDIAKEHYYPYRYIPAPLVRGTVALFVGDLEFYEDIRTNKIKITECW